MSELRPSFRFLSVSFFILLPLVLAQQDPASCTVSCRFVVVPTVGPPGLNGTTGIQGPIGPIGATGQTGAQGAQGVMGPAGAKGDKGDKGDTGATGQTGSQGIQGIQGIQGPKGDKGDTGATGQTGLQGLQGPKGDTGVFDPMSTLNNPTITGKVAGVTYFDAVVAGPDAPTACKGSTIETRLTLTVGRFGYAQIGSLIKWTDGSSSVVIDASTSEQQLGTTGRIYDEIVRTDMDCLFYSGRNNFMHTNQVTAIGQPVIHHDIPGAGARTVTLSLEPMQRRNKAVWSFPAPPGVGWDTSYNDTFVGKDMVQTITNKVLASPSITGVVSGNPLFPKMFGTSNPVMPINGHSCQNAASASGTFTASAGVCTFNSRSVGGVILWNDGTTSRVLGYTSQYVLTLDDTVSRASQSFRILNGDQHFSADGTYTNMREPRIHSSLASVQISLAAMTSTQIATWNFPAMAGSTTFVGIDTTQTLSNKVFTSIEFVPLAGATPPIWTALNGRDYTDATKSPPTPSQPPTPATGALTMNSFETVRFKMPVSGHLTGTAQTLWIEFTVTRIDNLVTFSAGEVLVQSVNVKRPAASIDIGTAANAFPTRFRPAVNMHISTWVIDNGVHVIGRLVAFADGRMRVDSGNGAFISIAAGASVYSGIQSLNGNWHVPASTYN